MKTRLFAAVALIAIGSPAFAHRLDEYLQATTISIEKDHVRAEIRLTPGIAVLGKVIAAIDTNGDGKISEAEQRGYAQRVLRDLSLSVDGKPLELQVASSEFPLLAEMKKGQGEIQLAFDASVPKGSLTRTLDFQNHHQSRIATYLVNCLVPSDPNLAVTGQRRNFLQSSYRVTYRQSAPVRSTATPLPPVRIGWWGGATFISIGLVWWARRRNFSERSLSAGPASETP